MVKPISNHMQIKTVMRCYFLLAKLIKIKKKLRGQGDRYYSFSKGSTNLSGGTSIICIKVFENVHIFNPVI